MATSIAELLEQQILGEDRRAMSCGCVMRINEYADRNGACYFAFPDVRCEAHRKSCPYVNAKVPNE